MFGKSRSFRNLGMLTVSSILGSGISSAFWIFLAGIMGAENYGELSYYITIGGIITSLVFVGGPNGLTVLVAKKIKVESTIITLSLSASLISAIILYLSFLNIGLSVYVIGSVIYNLSVSELLGRKYYKNYSILFLVQKILSVILALVFYFILGPNGVLLGIGLSFLIFIPQIYSSFKSTPINFCLLKSKWKFLTNNFLTDLSRIFHSQIDKLIIAPFFGFAVLGNYYLAIQILIVLAIAPEIVKKFTIPEDSSGENTTRIKILTVCFSIPLALLGIFVIPEMVVIFFPDYHDSVNLIPIISIAIIPATISAMYDSEFFAREKTFYLVLANTLAMAVMIISIILLGEIFGILGLAYSLLLSYSVRATILYSFNYLIKKNE